jgi:hypothetical protein
MGNDDQDLQEVEMLTILRQLSDDARQMLLGAARGLLKADAAPSLVNKEREPVDGEQVVLH